MTGTRGRIMVGFFDKQYIPHTYFYAEKPLGHQNITPIIEKIQRQPFIATTFTIHFGLTGVFSFQDIEIYLSFVVFRTT